MPGCCCLGEAAAIAAARCGKENADVPDIDMRGYREELKQRRLILS